jgi:hypothetical protein
MTRRKRIALWLGAVLPTAVILAGAAVYWAAHSEPAFYRPVLDTPQADMQNGRERMLQKAAAIHGCTLHEGQWSVHITAAEINGWLGVELANFPNLLPPTLQQPRVAMDGKGITTACHYTNGFFNGILSLTVRPAVTKNHVLVLRIVHARLGLLPAPLAPIIQSITQAARDMHFQVQWQKTEGDNVALLTLLDDPDCEYRTTIESIDLKDGEIQIACKTEKK